MGFDAHAKPPHDLRNLFKSLQRHGYVNDTADEESIRSQCYGGEYPDLVEQPFHAPESLQTIFKKFLDDDSPEITSIDSTAYVKAYTHANVPGLTVVPGLLPIAVQQSLLDRLFHRDVLNPSHRSNVHFHHNIKYPLDGSSFFALVKDDTTSIIPKDAASHKIMSTQKFLEKKLRWVTLGGQYDWTNKQYPRENPPAFPEDLADLLRGLFPKTVAEAAILNLYSPGDTLSLHRDVSEQCSHGLISVSIGCECVFVVGLDGQQASEAAVLKLRSGDVVYMDGASRFAWHGVPAVIADTCPPELSDWPASKDQCNSTQMYQHWRGWLRNKRINLNVRQMQ